MSRANEEGVDDERLAREICDVHSPKKKVDEHFFVSSEKGGETFFTESKYFRPVQSDKEQPQKKARKICPLVKVEARRVSFQLEDMTRQKASPKSCFFFTASGRPILPKSDIASLTFEFSCTVVTDELLEYQKEVHQACTLLEEEHEQRLATTRVDEQCSFRPTIKRREPGLCTPQRIRKHGHDANTPS